MMAFDYSKIYTDPQDFFQLSGSVKMTLSREAAIEVCRMCAEKEQIVVRYEGGIWHNPGFESRLDCIWDSKVDPPISREGAHKSNLLAIDSINEDDPIHNVYILTTSPIKGYPHKMKKPSDGV